MFLTTEEVAEILRCSTRTLEIWRKSAKGPPWTKKGRKVLYYKDKFYKWCEQ